MNTTVRSSAGSTQNAVLAAPPQRTRRATTGASCDRVEVHRETQAEADTVERRLGEERPAERSRSTPPGRWLRVM